MIVLCERSFLLVKFWESRVLSSIIVSPVTLDKSYTICVSMSSITKWKEGGLDYSIFKALFNNKWMISFYFKQDQIDITPA